jgi:hypothetical protein
MGNAESSKSRLEDEEINDANDINDNSKLRNPLISTLSRRNKRKAGFTDDNDSDGIYKKMKESPNNLPSHLQTCLDYHQTKPWLEKTVKYTLIAYPSIGTNPPDDLKVFFNNTPYNPMSIKENKDIKKNGNNYIWYMPSKFLWKAHCYVQHQKDSQISCNSNKLIRTFTDVKGNIQSFIFGVVFQDDTFRILNESDYKKECEWWNKQSTLNGGFGERKMLIKSKSIKTKEGDTARTIMKNKIADIFTKIGKISSADDSFIESIEEQFIFNISENNQITIYDYVENCLRIFIFANPDSPLSKHTLPFRTRISRGYFNIEIIPKLTTEEMFPEYHAQSIRGNVENVKNWIISYLNQEIEDFFDMLIIYLDPTIRNPTKVRDSVGDIPDDNIKNIKEYCDSDSSPEDIVIYKDDDDTIYCFNINDIINRKSNKNPLNPDKIINREFLDRFDKEFNKKRRNHIHENDFEKDKKNHKCNQCSKSVNDYVLRTGFLEKDGDELKANIKEFCSSECLEEYKQMEELFGSSSEEENEKNNEEILRREKENKKILKEQEDKYNDLQNKYNELQDNITQLENSLRISQGKIEQLTGEKNALLDEINSKEKLLENKQIELEKVTEKIASKVGVQNPSKMSVNDILQSMDQKDIIRNNLSKEKEKLEKEIYNSMNEIKILKENLNNKVVETGVLNKTIEDNIKVIEEKDKRLNNAKEEVSKALKLKEEQYDILKHTVDDLEKERNILSRQIKSVSDLGTEKEKNLYDALKIKEEELNRKLNETVSQCSIEKTKIENDKERNNHRLVELNESYINEQKLKNEIMEQLKLNQKLLIDKETEITNLNSKILNMDDLKKQINEITPLVATSETAKREYTQLKLKFDELQSVVASKNLLEAEITDLKRELNEAKSKVLLCATDDMLSSKKKEIINLTSQIKSKDNIIEELNKRILTYKNKNKECENNSNIEEELNKLKIDHKKELDKKEEEFEKQVNDIKGEFEEKMKKIPVINKTNDDKKRVELEREIRAKYEKILEKQQETIKDTYKNELDELKNKIKEDTQVINEANIQKEEMKREIEELSKKSENEDIVNILKDQIVNLEDAIQDTKKLKEEEKEKYDEMIKKYEKDLEEAKDACDKSCDEKCSGLVRSSSDEEKKSTEIENSMVKREIEKKEQEIEKLKKDKEREEELKRKKDEQKREQEKLEARNRKIDAENKIILKKLKEEREQEKLEARNRKIDAENKIILKKLKEEREQEKLKEEREQEKLKEEREQEKLKEEREQEKLKAANIHMKGQLKKKKLEEKKKRKIEIESSSEDEKEDENKLNLEIISKDKTKQQDKNIKDDKIEITKEESTKNKETGVDKALDEIMKKIESISNNLKK